MHGHRDAYDDYEGGDFHAYVGDDGALDYFSKITPPLFITL